MLRPSPSWTNEDDMQQSWNSDRRRTAIGRNALSVPARQALADRQLTPDRTILDYGCGRGGDVRSLERLDCRITGWDPYYSPEDPLVPSDVVLLTYVLNVIEDAAERRQTLKQAWELATTVLIVSARLTWEKAKVRGQEFGDDLLTSRQTFQRLFGSSELRNYIEEVTGARCVSAAPGIVYAFKDDAARLGYLAHRIVPDAEWLASEDTTSAIASLADYVERRGRPPRVEEMPRPMAEQLSRLKSGELRRLIRDSVDGDKVKDGGKRTTLNTLLFLAVELFSGRGPFGSLPFSVQLDVRSFFSSYKEACQRSDRLLLKLRDDAYVRGAMHASAVGKLTPTSLRAPSRNRSDADRPPPVRALCIDRRRTPPGMDHRQAEAPGTSSELARLPRVRCRPASADLVLVPRRPEIPGDLAHLLCQLRQPPAAPPQA